MIYIPDDYVAFYFYGYLHEQVSRFQKMLELLGVDFIHRYGTFYVHKKDINLILISCPFTFIKPVAYTECPHYVCTVNHN